MFVTARERLAERAEAQADDAAERLATIAEARADALAKITAALDEFIETVDRERVDGADIAEDERRTALEIIDEQLGEVSVVARSDLEAMELGEGRHDLRSSDNDEADRWVDERRDDMMEKRS